MDRDKLKRELTEHFQSSLDQAIEAVEKTPDGQWIAARLRRAQSSREWQIREIFQKLMGETFEKVLQARLDAADQAAFSPSKQSVGKQGPAGSGRAVRRG